MRAMLAVLAILAAAPAAAQLPPWAVEGERLRLEMTYLGLAAGEMVLEASPDPATGTVRLGMRTTSASWVSRFYQVDDRLESVLAVQGETTLLSRMKNREGKRQLEELVLFDPTAGVARRWKNGRERDLLITPAPTLDTLSAIYVLRTLPLEVGRSFPFTVQSGSKVHRMTVAVREKRTAKTPAGTLEVFVVEPSFASGSLLSSKGKTTLWVGAAPPRPLVRVNAELPVASLAARLVASERPWRGMVESLVVQGGIGKEQDGPQTR